MSSSEFQGSFGESKGTSQSKFHGRPQTNHRYSRGLVSEKWLVYLTFILVNLGLLARSRGLGLLGYIIYSSFLLGFLVFFYRAVISSKLSLSLTTESKAFLLIFLNGFIHISVIPISGLFQLFFLLSALLPAIVLRGSGIDIKSVSVFFMASFAFIVLGRDFQLDLTWNSIVQSSTSSLETNQHPFVFGLFALYFAYKRQYLWLIILLVFCLLSFKRIVALGLLICLPIAFYESKRRLGYYFRFATFVGICLGVYVLFLIANGGLDESIRQATGISTGWFTQGRDSLYREVFAQFASGNVLELFIGQGHGVTTAASIAATGHAAHSDILVLLVDHGLVITGIFIMLLLRSRFLFLSIYTIILFFTDNTLTYTVYLFSYFMVLMSLVESVNVDNQFLAVSNNRCVSN